MNRYAFVRNLQWASEKVVYPIAVQSRCPLAWLWMQGELGGEATQCQSKPSKTKQSLSFQLPVHLRIRTTIMARSRQGPYQATKRVTKVVRTLTVCPCTSTKMKMMVTRGLATLTTTMRSDLTASMTSTGMEKKQMLRRSTGTMNARRTIKFKCCQLTQWMQTGPSSMTRAWMET